MTSDLQIQTDVLGYLTVELAPWGIAVRSLRKLIVENELDAAMLPLIDVNGMHGCACAVELPITSAIEPNLPGPQCTVALSALVIESPTENFGVTGTKHSAEEVAKRIRQLLHQWAIRGIGTMFARGDVQVPTDEIEGHVGYRVTLHMTEGQEVLAKSVMPVIAGDADAITMTVTDGGTIYYTVDGESFPGLDLANARLYSAPFAIASGTVLRAVNYAASSVGSNLEEFTVPTP